MTEFERVRDALVHDLHELKRALFPAASPDITDVISTLTDDPSKGLRTAAGEWISGQRWSELPEDRKIEEMTLLKARVREKLDRMSAPRGQNGDQRGAAKWIAIVALSLVAAGALLWLLL